MTNILLETSLDFFLLMIWLAEFNPSIYRGIQGAILCVTQKEC